MSTDFKFSGYLEPQEVHAIINEIPLVSRHIERDTILVELLWQSGARVTEALTLVPERVGMTSVVLRNLKQVKKVKDESGKLVKTRNDSAIKEIEVSELICTRLKEFCEQNHILPGEWVFKGNMNPNKQLNRWYVWDMLTRVSERAHVFKFGKKDIRTGGRFKGAYPHILRHSNATFLLEATGDISLVQEQLGHASVQTTQGYAVIKKPKIKRLIKNIEW